MFRRSKFYLSLTIMGVLSFFVVFIGSVLPAVFHGSISQSAWDTALLFLGGEQRSPIDILSFISMSITMLFFCAMFFPVGITVSIFSERWEQDGMRWLRFGVMFACIGIIISLFFDAMFWLSGYKLFPSPGAPLTRTYGPGIWLVPMGFILCHICYSLLFFQEFKARKRVQVERSQNEIIEPDRSIDG